MKVPESTLFWLSLLLLIVLGVACARRPSRQQSEDSAPTGSKADAKPGFKDFVKNPRLWDELVESQERLQAVIDDAKLWNDEEVSEAVQRYVFTAKESHESRPLSTILGSLGKRTHPVLLGYLRDAHFQERLRTPDDAKGVLPQTPFSRVCGLIQDDPPEESIELLKPFLKDSSDQIRKEAALVIASIGSVQTIEPIRQALADTDEYVRSYAIIGLGRALKAKRLHQDCQRELFSDLQQTISKGYKAQESAELLLKFDRPAATKYLISDELLRVGSKSLDDVLKVCTDEEIRIPREKLLSLIKHLDKPKLEHPAGYQLGEALRALGVHQIPSDREQLENYLSHMDSQVSSGAASALLASHGLQKFRERIWKQLENGGFESLSMPQRRIHAVSTYDGEVRNGGHDQYFFNSSGDEWKAAVEGLEAMGSTERLAILREAISQFGPSGPSNTRRERMDQLSKLARADGPRFDKLDSRYYKSKESLDVLEMRYVVKNADSFR